jgi:putative transposase
VKYKKHRQYRLKDFDYSGEGEYFITICIADHKKYFGKIIDEMIILSPVGKIVDRIWNQVPDRFENVKIDTYQIMPDHFHGIIILEDNPRHLINQMPTYKSGIKNNPMEMNRISLGSVIRWFKGRVKYDAGEINPDFKWQNRYYDRIIRDEKEFYFIREYIMDNPRNRDTGILKDYFDNKL